MAAQTTSPTTTDLQAAPAQTPAPGATPDDAPVAGTESTVEPRAPGFRQRGRMRRRLRYLRKARELAYRDLGGLLFEMHRLGQRHDELVAAKLTTLGHIDTELRTLQDALGERGAVTVLREAGVAACPRCAAIHGSDDRFCPACGMPMGRRADRPVAATPPSSGAAEAPTTTAPPAAPQSALPPSPPIPSAPAPAPAAAAMPPAPTPSPAPATPLTAVHPPVAAQPSQPPAGPDEDRPTEIIRPSDSAGA